MNLDRFVISLDNALRTLSGAVSAGRPCPHPGPGADTTPLDDAERREAAALMRVNHVGEVCAQALYQAQSLTSTDPELRRHLDEAAREEADHLAWTQKRLGELGGRRSLLNPLWYAGAFGIGLLAGRAGEKTSLGFIVETERQVEQHLEGHMTRLPAHDQASRAIVEQMKTDEARHADMALSAGARRLPLPVRLAMRAAARVMTATAHRI